MMRGVLFPAWCLLFLAGPVLAIDLMKQDEAHIRGVFGGTLGRELRETISGGPWKSKASPRWSIEFRSFGHSL